VEGEGERDYKLELELGDGNLYLSACLGLQFHRSFAYEQQFVQEN